MREYRHLRLLPGTLVILLFYIAVQYTLADGNILPQAYTVSTQKSFDDVIEDLKFAISEANFRLTSENKIGAAISKQTGEPYPKARIIHFCNLEYARIFLNSEPNYLINMPCRVAVQQSQDRVIIQTWLQKSACPQLDKPVAEINSILKKIVDYGAE